MKIVFASNYFNHHQKPFSDAMHNLIGDGYAFIETMPMEEERLKMGWGNEEKPAYVKQNYIDEQRREQCQTLIDEADVVIFGSAPYELFKNRLKAGKLTFLYTERLYKTGYEAWKWPVRLVRFWNRYGKYKNLYLLCASAYTAGDFAKTFTFINKAYKWGYFPETKRYADIESVIKEKTPASILWVARFIDLKHPEYAVEVARRLQAEGYDFTLNMIGSGEREEVIRKMIQENGLSNCVKLLGSMKPEEVRSYMEKSEVFLFTSDRNEGWGAVLNESMNSGCAVVACNAIGSVPFLLENGKNGMTYASGDIDALYENVKYLLDNPQICDEMGRRAYELVTTEWNAENAAFKFLQLCRRILGGEHKLFLFKNGLCSKAKVLKDD